MPGKVRSIMVMAVLLVGAACGGGDDDASGTAALLNQQDGSATTFPSSVGDLPGVSSECEAFAELSLAITSVLTGGFDELPTNIVDRLPRDAQADGQIMLDALDEYQQRLEQAGIDISQGINLNEDQFNAFAEISSEAFDDDVDAAMERLGTTMAGECVPGS